MPVSLCLFFIFYCIVKKTNNVKKLGYDAELIKAGIGHCKIPIFSIRSRPVSYLREMYKQKF